MNFQASVNKKVCAEPISRVLKFRRFVQGVPSCLQHLCMEVEAAANAAEKDSLGWCLPHPAPIPAFEQPRPNRLKQLSRVVLCTWSYCVRHMHGNTLFETGND